MTRHLLFPTMMGACGIVWADDNVAAFALPREPSPRPEKHLVGHVRDAATHAVPAWVHAIVARVQAHFAGDLQDFSDVVLDWSRVSDFQQAVYRHTQAVKPGHTTSYGEIARRMALPPAGARAVGVALASNPWPLLVPCHRVIAADGKMTGFSGPGGVRTKTRLLALEGAELLSE